jgi:hypothetical protein
MNKFNIRVFDSGSLIGIVPILAESMFRAELLADIMFGTVRHDVVPGDG